MFKITVVCCVAVLKYVFNSFDLYNFLQLNCTINLTFIFTYYRIIID